MTLRRAIFASSTILVLGSPGKVCLPASGIRSSANTAPGWTITFRHHSRITWNSSMSFSHHVPVMASSPYGLLMQDRLTRTLHPLLWFSMLLSIFTWNFHRRRTSKPTMKHTKLFTSIHPPFHLSGVKLQALFHVCGSYSTLASLHLTYFGAASSSMASAGWLSPPSVGPMDDTDTPDVSSTSAHLRYSIY